MKHYMTMKTFKNICISIYFENLIYTRGKINKFE